MAKQPISVKFPKEMLADLDQECEGLGCNRTDFVIEAVTEKLQKSTNGTEDQESKQDNKKPPKAKLVINLDDPPKPEPIIKEVIKEILQDNSNKPQADFVLFNGKYIPKAEVYEI